LSRARAAKLMIWSFTYRRTVYCKLAVTCSLHQPSSGLICCGTRITRIGTSHAPISLSLTQYTSLHVFETFTWTN
jgi:hypothetical protein